MKYISCFIYSWNILVETYKDNKPNMGKIIKARIGTFALSLKYTNNAVPNIIKKPMPDPSKILWAPDLNDIRDKNKIIPVVIDPAPMIYLRVTPTSSASGFVIVFGNMRNVIFSAKIKNDKPRMIITRPLSASIVLELCNISW